MPLKPESPASCVDLGADRVELGRQAGADRGVRGLLRLADERLGRLHQLGDRRDAVVGGLNRVDAVDIESSRLFRSLARLSRPCAVKKLFGLSRAELTRLPVASLVWVAVIRSEVCCNCSRFDRTPADKNDVRHLTYLSGLHCRTGSYTCRSSGSAIVIAWALPTARKSSWLMTCRVRRRKISLKRRVQNTVRQIAPRATVMVSKSLKLNFIRIFRDRFRHPVKRIAPHRKSCQPRLVQ